MELRDIISIISLLSTLVMIAFIIGTLRSVFATKAELVALEKDIRNSLTAKERESLSAHNSFVTRAEFERFEEKFEKKSGQIEAKIDIVNSSVSRLLNLYHRDHKTPKEGHDG